MAKGPTIRVRVKPRDEATYKRAYEAWSKLMGCRLRMADWLRRALDKQAEEDLASLQTEDE